MPDRVSLALPVLLTAFLRCLAQIAPTHAAEETFLLEWRSTPWSTLAVHLCHFLHYHLFQTSFDHLQSELHFHWCQEPRLVSLQVRSVDETLRAAGSPEQLTTVVAAAVAVVAAVAGGDGGLRGRSPPRTGPPPLRSCRLRSGCLLLSRRSRNDRHSLSQCDPHHGVQSRAGWTDQLL